MQTHKTHIRPRDGYIVRDKSESVRIRSLQRSAKSWSRKACFSSQRPFYRSKQKSGECDSWAEERWGVVCVNWHKLDALYSTLIFHSSGHWELYGFRSSRALGRLGPGVGTYDRRGFQPQPAVRPRRRWVICNCPNSPQGPTLPFNTDNEKTTEQTQNRTKGSDFWFKKIGLNDDKHLDYLKPNQDTLWTFSISKIKQKQTFFYNLHRITWETGELESCNISELFNGLKIAFELQRYIRQTQKTLAAFQSVGQIKKKHVCPWDNRSTLF